MSSTYVYVPEYAGYQDESYVKLRLKKMRRWWLRLSRLQKSFIFTLVMSLFILSLIFLTQSYSPQLSNALQRPGAFQLNSQNSPNSQLQHNSYEKNANFPHKTNEERRILASKDSSTRNAHLNQGEEPMTLRPLLKEPMRIFGGLEVKKYENSWEGLPLQRDGVLTVEEKISTEGSSRKMHRALTSTVEPVVTKQSLLKDLIGDQVKENIRSVISRDPVIPLPPKRHLKPPTTKISPPHLIFSSPSSMSNLKFNGPQNSRQKAVVEAFLHCWKGYKQFAWGRDHLLPISGQGKDWLGLGLTLVDSLDTLYIMGLKNEFYEARDWVEDSLTFDKDKVVNLFETTIRVMGGLLSSYHLTGDQIFLNKANDLGDQLIGAFKSPSGIPFSDINLKTHESTGPQWNPDSSTSEVSTIQLEFRDLSRHTKNAIYENSAMNVSLILHRQVKPNGLVPIFISPFLGKLRSTATVTLGARGDSYYEYLLKQWIQTGKKIDFLRDDYLESVRGIRDLLVKKTSLSNLTFIGELESNRQSFRAKMDHLVCYLPGTLALGYYHGLPAWHMQLAEELIYTCYLTYKLNPTGLAAEISYFRTDGDKTSDFYVRPNDAHSLLRPETIESLWYMSQITGAQKYSDWGWEIFNSFVKYTKVEHGFSSISNVMDPNDTRPRDMMESFFLGETLKYFYLLFSSTPIFNLNSTIFNTEAHPLPIYSS